MASLEQLVAELTALEWLEAREREREKLREEISGITAYMLGNADPEKPYKTDG